jgi:dsRNA-specific ribonuclease
VLVGAYVAARGEGRSKQQAEQAAAARALEDPGWLEANAETGG